MACPLRGDKEPRRQPFMRQDDVHWLHYVRVTALLLSVGDGSSERTELSHGE